MRMSGFLLINPTAVPPVTDYRDRRGHIRWIQQSTLAREDLANFCGFKIPAADVTLKEAALPLGFVSKEGFDLVVDPSKMVRPYVAACG